MVQRLMYRRRHCYATKSNRVRIVKTPGEEQLAELLLERNCAERHARLQVAS